MLEKLRNILQNNIERIYYLGVFDSDDKEFILSDNYLYIEFSEELVSFDVIEGNGKLCITFPEKISEKILLEDVAEGKVGIENIVLNRPFRSGHKVVEIMFYNLEIQEKALFSDVVVLKLVDDQIIFIDSGYSGITIGGIEKKELWYQNLDEESKGKLDFFSIGY